MSSQGFLNSVPPWVAWSCGCDVVPDFLWDEIQTHIRSTDEWCYQSRDDGMQLCCCVCERRRWTCYLHSPGTFSKEWNSIISEDMMFVIWILCLVVKVLLHLLKTQFHLRRFFFPSILYVCFPLTHPHYSHCILHKKQKQCTTVL